MVGNPCCATDCRAASAITACPRADGCSRSTAQQSRDLRSSTAARSSTPVRPPAVATARSRLSLTADTRRRTASANGPSGSSSVGSCSRATRTSAPLSESGCRTASRSSTTAQEEERRTSLRPTSSVTTSGRSDSAAGSCSTTTSRTLAPGRARDVTVLPGRQSPSRTGQVCSSGTRTPTPSPQLRLSPRATSCVAIRPRPAPGGAAGARRGSRRRWPTRGTPRPAAVR